MGRSDSYFGLKLPIIGFLSLVVPLTLVFSDSVRAFTSSVGQPYHGRLVNGISFPDQFQGYYLRNGDRSYSTPEVVGALLDALDSVRQQNPATCELFLGDFSLQGGGGINHHRSHQNGRDVDLGMYAKGNRPLDTFMPMNGENLDVPKTWSLVENLIRSQRVQYIFLDRRIQNLLYDYAQSRGVDPIYLDHLFGNTRGSIIQHARNHHDHIHVRFYTPWSTMAAQVSEADEQKRTIIEMAQQAYLPKKVNYYVKGTEPSLDALAHSFGVNRKDLVRWNQVQGNDTLRPGSCIVFYKRGFELEPVHLAQSLQPSSVPEMPVQLASLRSARTMSDASVSLRSSNSRERRYEQPAVVSYKVRKGDTLKKVAMQTGMDLKTLTELNGLKKNAALKPGQKIKVAGTRSPVIAAEKASSHSSKATGTRLARAGSSNGSQTSGEMAFMEESCAVGKRGKAPKTAVMNPTEADRNHKAQQKIRLAEATPSGKGSKVASDAAASSSPPRSSKSLSSKKNVANNKKATSGSSEATSSSTRKTGAKASAQGKSTSKADSAVSASSPSSNSKTKVATATTKKGPDVKKVAADSSVKQKSANASKATKNTQQKTKKPVN